ncbi:hypothetical protein PR048_000093 [Dryococelus australis]|uniref:Uncharacterized protein n=1 Tax=Dryococelus australis TaxID=614101 RepID=A0ABQ9IEM1_9NEOP|nr:hypothetical protein PR048_000093 [Dryococelus australis]
MFAQKVLGYSYLLQGERTQFEVGLAADGGSCGSSKHSSDEEEDNMCLYVGEQSSLVPDSGIDSIHLFVPNVGIVMSKKVADPSVFSLLAKDGHLHPTMPFIANESLSCVVNDVSLHNRGLSRSRSDLSLRLPQVNKSTLSVSQASLLSQSPHNNSVTTPEITVENANFPKCLGSTEQSSITSDKIANETSPDVKSARQEVPSATKLTPPNTLHFTRKLSHSSGEVDQPQVTKVKSETDTRITNDKDKETGSIPRDAVQNFLTNQRSSSVKDLSLNITSSQSENAIRSIRSGFTAITSPVAATRELVLSPFSKLAKGMQHLGANLDPRRLKAPSGAPHSAEEQHQLQLRWKGCRSRLIAV